MRASIALAIFAAYSFSHGQFQDPAQTGRYEVSGYLNLASYGENVAMQSDLGIGLQVFRHVSLEVTSDINYRNYSLVTNEYLSAALGGRIGKHGLRAGAVAGIYTLS